MQMTVEGSAAIDVTTLFKSCVKTIRTRNKAMGIVLPQSKILPTASTQFYSRVRDIQSNINSHKNLLNEHKKKYLNDQDQAMSNQERNYMEKVVATNLRLIDEQLKNLEDCLKDAEGSEDGRECRKNMAAILRNNFQVISSLFKEMREIRQKRRKEKEQLFRLQRPGGPRKRSDKGAEDLGKPLDRIHSHQSGEEDSPVHRTKDRFNTDGLSTRELDTGSNTSTPGGRSLNYSETSLLDEDIDGLLNDLSVEERQMLEEENTHIYQELQSNQEEVKQITRQVAELGQMQDLLTENVNIQAHQIESIQDSVMAATENVREGNEQVREAMRKDAGFRVWIMFFLIVMSFTILFLDWYNS
ncbi:syntaxin 18 isoform X2 [Oratosquilla oratoria]|uniref:syntaxin 18 isoform X2 n=1 Tax=Oratosquilla oratoria TaxID=337810 RepID=UPI003F75979B